MSWTIDDSEDDGELSPVRPLHRQTDAAEPKDASTSTGSTDSTTELLRRAHADLIAPTPTGDMVDMASPIHTKKRRNTLTAAEEPPKKTKLITYSRSQSTQASYTSIGVQDAIIEEYAAPVLPPTGDTVRIGTIEQDQLVQNALNEQNLGAHLANEKSTPNTTHHDESSPMPWSAHPSENRTQSTEQAAQATRSDEPRSDDFAGLPLEHYQPRPSRSRSTQATNESVDWSARPETAAKKKRTKTMGSQPDPSSSADPLQIPSPEAKRSQEKRTKRPLEPVTEIPEAVPEVVEETPQENSAETTASLPTMEPEKHTEVLSQASVHSAVEVRIPPRSTDMPPPPTIPTPARKRGRPPKARSHTTIFEDHVGLESVQSSPNLRQQQAVRKTGTPTKEKGKKGPKKDDAADTTKPAVEIPDSNENTAATSSNSTGPEPEVVVATATIAPSAAEMTFLPASSADLGTAKENTVCDSQSAGSTTTLPVTLSTPLEKKKQPDPNTHSPIKKSGTVFRVGLSKRQKIRPLLKIVGR